MLGALVEQKEQFSGIRDLPLFHVFNGRLPRPGISANLETTGAFAHGEHVQQVIFIQLHEMCADCRTEALLVEPTQALEHRLCCSWGDATGVVITAVECVGLSCARLAIREDGDIVTVHRRLHKVLHFSEHLVLPRRRSEDSVELHCLPLWPHGTIQGHERARDLDSEGVAANGDDVLARLSLHWRPDPAEDPNLAFCIEEKVVAFPSELLLVLEEGLQLAILRLEFPGPRLQPLRPPLRDLCPPQGGAHALCDGGLPRSAHIEVTLQLRHTRLEGVEQPPRGLCFAVRGLRAHL
mmetsp:Transcript_86965/g.251191  ORF Transcript_86965/g.251191 Transcript_86965/m.251191 type:complete len:295 (+) Transcript_86965:749-1633(+)